MASYAEMDEATLKAKLSEAETYEERSLIRQALRQKKKERGEPVQRTRGGGSVYNRFAASSRSTAPSPKNYVASAQAPAAVVVKPKTEPPPRRPSPVEQVDVPPHVEEEPQPSLVTTPPLPEPTPPSPEPTPPPREPTPPPREPTPPPLTPPETPPPQESPSPCQSPREPTPPPEEDVDGCSDPGLGEEGVSPESPPAEMEEESVETPPTEPPKARERAIEEDTDGVRPTRSAQTKVDFGVKLKATPPKTQSKPTTRPSPSGAPRTLRDYQELSARSKASRPLTPEDRPIAGDELQQYLVAYVNKELELRPPLPARGRALYETASDPANLCKLINKSVKDTVDPRALTKTPVRGSAAAKREALQDNMMLAVESARAIGCAVTDDTGSKILSGDPDTIRQFLVDLIRARVTHMPAMEDEPSSTFTNLPLLFSKLDIRLESVDGGEDATPPSQDATPPSKVTSQEAVTYEERAALRRMERERKRSGGGDTGDDGQEMTYEERAAKRRLERERRRKEREALAK